MTMLITGVDEVGLGCLAGPIVATAVTLETDFSLELLRQWWPVPGINDSKKLSPKKREALKMDLTLYIINRFGEVGTSIVSVDYINEHGYAKAHQYALWEAVENATQRAWLFPDLVVVDGNRVIEDLEPRQRVEPKADENYFHVAAASILAKTTRDALMTKLSQEHPEYGWGKNKGYGTKDHRDALVAYGLSPHHRTLPCETVLSKVAAKKRPTGW